MQHFKHVRMIVVGTPSATDLHSVTFTPEQLEALAKAGGGNDVHLNDLALDASSFTDCFTC
jgi:hypothetical protein